MTRLARCGGAAALLLLTLPVVARAQDSPPASASSLTSDSLLVLVRQAQRLVNAGSGAAGRAMLDSLLEQTEPRSAQEAEVLFWRASMAESWELAQRDYLRVMLEHEGRERAADAMLRLAQGELARGDRAAALRYLERLAREAPESGARAEGGLWQGRLLVERGARDEGCAVLRDTRPRVPTGAIELENQYDYLLRGCAAATSAAPASPSPPAPTPAPTTPPATPPAPTATPPAAEARTPRWSVQVAAFSTATEAQEFAAEVTTLGFPARVDGSTAPFRVRFGRFATRAEAAAAMTAYRTKSRADAFLTQVPPE